ncbi:MAG: bifunctional phosphopantothenoylcysteine decarboxylase/phosphopantothenate--cysteine ligase CoaBC [Microbacteriaceae bacterium]|nr:bifunctional phosphopantothenoylcysteine decarboxylase/phosphopantothenate--cysteine ligase CoaBC [Microbacteriaceae bacterium]
MSSHEESVLSPRVVVGVSGGIAAYKAVSLVRELVLRGAHVTVIPTASALKFVGMPTWEAISRNPVTADLFDGVAEVRHVALGQQADLIILAPATAHTLASVAGGFAGDLLGTTILASSAPLVIAPAMHTEMWENPAVRANVELLRGRGALIVGPESGALTGDDRGPGRMSEPADIADVALGALVPKTLRGKRVLISVGGTREYLDPVRFIGNRSSGEMGTSLARAALARGAEVTIVHAHFEASLPSGARAVSAPTAQEMHDVMMAEQSSHDIVIMAAAVADWRVREPSEDKISKAGQGDSWSPDLVRTPDILRELGEHKTPSQLLVGFAAETDADEKVREQSARTKRETKGADVIVLNQVGRKIGFGTLDTAVTLISASPQSLSFEGSKTSVAGRLLDALPEH